MREVPESTFEIPCDLLLLAMGFTGPEEDLPGALGLHFDLSQVAPGIYGAILVLVVLLRPHGLAPGYLTAASVASSRWPPNRSRQTPIRYRASARRTG